MSSWSRWSWWRRLAVAGASVAAPALGCMLAAAAPALADEPPAKPSVAPAAFREQETKLPAPPPLAPEPTTIASPREPAPAPPPLPAEPSGSPADRQRWLAAKIDEILARPSLANAKVGVLVAEVDGGRTLYARNERALLNPASNAKLVTTAAALGLLGPEYRFKTGLWVDSYKSGEVNGNLYLKGSGDPAFVIEDLWKLVADLASQGVKRVTGAIAVDDTFFDEVRIGPAFEQKDEDAPFRAPAGAVSLNYNACTVHVLPTRDGQPPRVLVEPASPYFTIVDEAQTVAHGKTDLAIASREIEGHTEIAVRGTIRVGAPEQIARRRIAHPDLYAGYTLRELLRGRGIKVAGEVVRAAVPAGARQMASHLSPPLGVIVRDVNKTSNNFMAEQLLKTLGAEQGGRPGTWQKGVEAVGRFLDGIGIPAGKYKLVNGSGLYDADRFSPAQIVELLRAVYHDFRFAADFVGSLATAGEDGTMGHRMSGGPAERYVRAKTGTLDGVSCLSGYAGAPGRLPLAFSILMNDVAGDTARADARAAQDAIAATLVTFLEAK